MILFFAFYQQTDFALANDYDNGFEADKSLVNQIQEEQQSQKTQSIQQWKELSEIDDARNHLLSLQQSSYPAIQYYPSLFHIYHIYCTGKGHKTLSLPQSPQALSYYIQQAATILQHLQSLHDSSSTSFHDKQIKLDSSFNQAYQIISQLTNLQKQWSTNQQQSFSFYQQVHSLQTQLLKLLSVDCSQALIHQHPAEFSIQSLTCFLRDPFDKLMSFINYSSSSMDNWHVTIIAVIQQFYVMSIYEILLYLYLFCSTYQIRILLNSFLINRT